MRQISIIYLVFLFLGSILSLRDTFFKTRDERDWVCAKSSPNHLRFSDALKNAILCEDIIFHFRQVSSSLRYYQWKHVHARLLCMISFISTCKSYASVSATSSFFFNIFLYWQKSAMQVSQPLISSPVLNNVSLKDYMLLTF